MWQRVVGADGKVRWLHTLESPAALAQGASSVPPQAQVPAPSSSSLESVPAISSPVGATSERSAAASATATAVRRYWTSSRSRLPEFPPLESSPPSPRAAAGAGTLGGVGPGTTAAQDSSATLAILDGDEGSVDVTLSDVERGDGRSFSSSTPARGRRGLALIRPPPEGRSSSPDPEEDPGARGGRRGSPVGGEHKGHKGSASVVSLSSELLSRNEEAKITRSDSFGDEGMMLRSAAYYTT